MARGWAGARRARSRHQAKKKGSAPRVIDVMQETWTAFERWLRWATTGLRHGVQGQGMVEYALVLALVAVLAAAALSVMGNDVANVFSMVSSQLGAAAGS